MDNIDNGEGNQIILQKIAELESKIDAQNEVITKIYRVQRLGVYSRYAYWAFIILAGLGAFYFISPALNSLGNIYGSSGDILRILDGASSINGLSGLEGF